MSGNQFTFVSNPIHRKSAEDSNNFLSVVDPRPMEEYNTWSERIKGQRNYFGKPSDAAKLGAWTRRVPKKRTDYDDDDNNKKEEEEFRWLGKQEKSGSSTPSPELWKKAAEEESPMMIQSAAESSPVSNYSHGPRSQMIARYRQEMLDLVWDVPETAYELSLRDLVESPKMTTPLQQQETVEENSEEAKIDNKKKKKNNNNNTKKGNKKEMRRRISRSESMDTGGFFLRMFIPRLPSFLGGKRRSGSDSVSAGTCAKVSPKPVLVLADGERSTDREWWSSSSGSTSSASSGGSISSRTIRNCYSFFRTR